MSETLENLRHKMTTAGELHAVVRTMKALAASSISQYENAVRSLDVYYQTVQYGLHAALHQFQKPVPGSDGYTGRKGAVGIVLIGSDQGLVGQFNTRLLDALARELPNWPGDKWVWAVGERIHGELDEYGLKAVNRYSVPVSVGAITPLVKDILIGIESWRSRGAISRVYVFHNRPVTKTSYNSAGRQLMPLDAVWRNELISIHWPGKNLPEVWGEGENVLLSLIREYLFVSLFKACAESLASENASRLAAMERAEKNINELQDDLQFSYHQLRKEAIDEELFDVISGSEAQQMGSIA